MSVIPYPDIEDLDPDIADRLERLGSLNVHRMMAHSPDVMVAFSKLGFALLRRGALDDRLRELVILRIGLLCHSDYEWYQHVSVARAVGVPEEKISALDRGDLSGFDERERIALSFAEEVHAAGQVGSVLFARAQALFSHAELVELTIVAGYYVMTAAFLRTFAIERESTPPLGDTMKAHGLAVAPKSEASHAP